MWDGNLYFNDISATLRRSDEHFESRAMADFFFVYDAIALSVVAGDNCIFVIKRMRHVSNWNRPL